MSVRSIASAAVAAEVEATQPPAAQAPPPPTPTESIAAALERIARYIPSEALATYITLIALFNPSTTGPRWIIAGVGELLAVYLLWIGMAIERSTQQPTATSQAQLYKAGPIALIAYIVYVSAIPGTPFLGFSWFNLKIGGAAVIVAAVVVPPLAKVWGVAPQAS